MLALIMGKIAREFYHFPSIGRMRENLMSLYLFCGSLQNLGYPLMGVCLHQSDCEMVVSPDAEMIPVAVVWVETHVRMGCRLEYEGEWG